MVEVPAAVIAALCQAEGLAHLATMPLPGPLDPTGHDRLLADGVGGMQWLAEERGMRLDPHFLRPKAVSIICVAWHHGPGSDCGQGLKRAAYAAGKDYHVLLRPKLGRIGLALNRRYAADWQHRACVDSAPINERTLARMAGLGWLGRNALLIHPRTGSYRVLGFLLTEAPLETRLGGAGEHRCGSCTRCERACPTGALEGGRCLSERCISYLTIEHQDVIPRHLAERFQGWWFGCDGCQEVCPWNRFAIPAEDARLSGRDDANRLLALTASDYDGYFAGRALRRVPFERFRRNLLVALWSLGIRDQLPADDLPLVQAQGRELGITR